MFHLLAFLLFVAVFYRLLPQFLIQNHDAQNVYFSVTKGLEWRASILELYAYSPLSGLGTTFWPFSLPLIPYLAVFAMTEDPTLRIYLVQVAASTMLFAALLFFYLAVGAERRIAIAASWMSFLLVMLYGLAHVSAPENLQVTIWMYVALGALAKMGGSSRSSSFGWAILFQFAAFAFVLAVPAWHVVALPVFGSCILFLLWFSQSAAQRRWRLLSVLLAVAVQLAIGTYEALRFTLTDTARIALSSEFPVVPHFQGIAGHLFGDRFIDLLIGTLLMVGLGWTRLSDTASTAARAVHTATVFIYGSLVLTGLVFLYTSGPWPLPWPKYMLIFAYPVASPVIVGGIMAIPRMRADVSRLRRVALLLALYLGWHVANSIAVLAPVFAVAAILAVLAAFASGRTLLAGRALLCAALLYGVARNVEEAFGGGADHRFDGAWRAGLVRTPVIDFLRAQVALEPGMAFQGAVEDLYSRPADSKELIDTIISHWAANWMKYGNGHKLFAWSVMGIPTATEYNQYTRPQYFLLFTRLLNEPADRQVFNYLSLTRPDLRILQMLGVRYLVTDRPELALIGAVEVFRWDKFRVLELPHPNLATYSPTTLAQVESARDALARLSAPSFDPRRSVLVSADGNRHGPLVPAENPRLVFERGGFRVTARSPGASFLLLPVQFTHCLRADESSGARLVRANLALTGVHFSGPLDLKVRYVRWPMTSPECQRRDLEDTRRLLAEK